jgi:hypothetical protein
VKSTNYKVLHYFSGYFLRLRFKYPPRHLFWKALNFYFFYNVKDRVSHLQEVTSDILPGSQCCCRYLCTKYSIFIENPPAVQLVHEFPQATQHTLKMQLLNPILSQFNQTQRIHEFSKVYFNIIIRFILRSRNIRKHFLNTWTNAGVSS